jgi:hypothetical protein
MSKQINIKHNKLWKKYKSAIFILFFVAANSMSLLLVFRSSPLILELGIIKRFMVGVSSITIPAVYVIFLILLMLLAREEHIRSLKNIKLIFFSVLASASVVVLAHFYFDLMDLVKYPNYSFSRFNIYLPSLKFYANFQILVIVLTIFSYLVSHDNKFRKAANVNNIFKILIIGFLPIIIFNLISDMPFHIKDELNILYSYVLQENKEYRPDFDELKKQTEFIKKHVPENAVLIHPTQSAEYPLIGNQPLIRHDLYPRKLVSAKFAAEYLKTNGRSGVYFIYLGAKDFKTGEAIVYPSLTLNDVEVMVLFKDGRTEQYKLKTYQPVVNENMNKIEVGIIKLL